MQPEHLHQFYETTQAPPQTVGPPRAAVGAPPDKRFVAGGLTVVRVTDMGFSLGRGYDFDIPKLGGGNSPFRPSQPSGSEGICSVSPPCWERNAGKHCVKLRGSH